MIDVDRRTQPRPTPLKFPFAKVERGRGLTEVSCRCCGAVIAKHMPVGEQRVRRVGNRTFIETDVQMCYLASYREVKIEMEDGSFHVGNCCADCAKKLQGDSELLASFYETDLKQWRSELATITAHLGNRRPRKVVAVGDYIRD